MDPKTNSLFPNKYPIGRTIILIAKAIVEILNPVSLCRIREIPVAPPTIISKGAMKARTPKASRALPIIFIP